jgi:hypothetical protein
MLPNTAPLRGMLLDVMSKSTISKKSQTDWERLEAMEDQDIDVSEIPELTPEMFAKVVAKRGLKDKENKTQSVFHRPHPRNETNQGIVKFVRRFLEAAGVKP